MEKRTMKKVRDMSLFQKMLFFYIAFLVIPTMLIGTFYIENFSIRLNEQYHQNKADILEQGCDFVENQLKQIGSCTRAFQYNTGVLRYVENYDLTTGTGVEYWTSYVKPAVDQLKTSNPAFSKICIYRENPKESNDFRYVLNALDNPELEARESMDYKTVKMFFQTENGHTTCHIYKALFDVSRVRKVGYVEMDCDADFLFAPLSFLGEQEVMLLHIEGNTYCIRRGEDGIMYLEKGTGDSLNSYNRASTMLKTINAEVEYCYPKLRVMTDSTMFRGFLLVLLLFLFFTTVYYAFYRSIVKRITNLTNHMLLSSGEKMQIYHTEPSRDEIGTMVSVYNQTADRMNHLIEEIYSKERSVNQAKYYAMQSQIQPHFLYNTLENIDMLIEIGENEKASRMMAVFGKILRYNLSMRREMSTVEEEVTHIEEYLKLYSFRMRDDFSYHIEMEAECGEVECPYCMLQPIVENCFKHGFRKIEEEKWVSVQAYRDGNTLRIDVEDNGVGITDERLRDIERKLYQENRQEQEMDTSIGLGNVNDRIRLLCRKGSGLRIYQREQGCMIRIEIRL